MRRDLFGDTRVGMGVALWALLLCSWALLLGFALGLCNWALQLGFGHKKESIHGKSWGVTCGRSGVRFSLGEDTHYLKYLDMHLTLHEDAGHV